MAFSVGANCLMSEPPGLRIWYHYSTGIVRKTVGAGLCLPFVLPVIRATTRDCPYRLTIGFISINHHL